MSRRCLSVILAAGYGTRMKSVLPKMLHKVGGLPLVCHVVRAIKSAGSDKIAVVVGGTGAQAIVAAVRKFSTDALIFEQKKPLGTANAVLSVYEALQDSLDDVLIAYGDSPLIEKTSILKVRKMLADSADIVVTGFCTDQPTGYGRLVEKQSKIKAIVEEKDASVDEKKITFCNGGLMMVKRRYLLPLLHEIRNDNVGKEYYLTDIVKLAAKRALKVEAIKLPMDDFVGVNNCLELAEAEVIWQRRKRQAMMLAGVTLQAPESVFFSYDTEIAADVIVEPHVFFGPGVKIASGTVVRAFSYIEGATIGANAEIGPYARLRPGADLDSNVKIGNFCEIKQATIGLGTKINHLSYVGDAEIGIHVNIGAGAITCNYDGYNKKKTRIGDGAFVGSNTSLVAPVSIGRHAYIASGSVITKNIPDNALTLGRARQVNKLGRAKILRKLFVTVKSKKTK